MNTYDNTASQSRLIKRIVTGFVGLVIVGFILSSFTIIDVGERGVVTRLGKLEDIVMEEGPHMKIPFMDDVTKMDVKVKAYNVSELTYSKDAQIVEAEVTLNYQLNPTYVKQVFTEVRRDYESVIINPAIKDAIKAVMSKYTAQGILDNRENVPSDMKEVLTEKLSEKGIIIKEVLVTNLDFDDDYEKAVKEKQVAEQEALKQANITKSEEEKKEQEILKAEALSEKTRLEAKALASQQGEKVIEKIKAEAMLEMAKKWDGRSMPQTVINGGGNSIPLIPFMNMSQ